MNKTILTLLMACMYVTGNTTTNAMEKKSKEMNFDRPHLRTTTFEQASLLQAVFYPEDKQDQIHLESALFKPFNPEDDLDDDEDLQLVLLVSRLQHFLLNGTIPLAPVMPGISSSHPRKLEVPKNVVIPDIQAVDLQEIPIYRAEDEVKLEPLIKPFVKVYSNLLQKVGASKVTVENLTDLFFQQSLEKDKGWPREPLEFIAKFLIVQNIPPYRKEYDVILPQLVEPFETMYRDYIKVTGTNSIPIHILTSLLLQYSDARSLGWSWASLDYIAQYIIDRDMPAYNTAQGKLEGLVAPCAKLCVDLAQKIGANKITIENLTELFLEYSERRNKGWAREHFTRIAKAIIYTDPLDSPRKDSSSSDSDDKK